jgi:hypothetical protein
MLFLGAVVLAIAVTVVLFADRAGRSTGVNLQRSSPVEPAMATKAQEHCWFNVKNRSGQPKASASGPMMTSSGSAAERIGDLIIVTGAIDQAPDDNRFYGCALYQYVEGSPVVVATKTSHAPLRPDALIPLGFTSEGKKQ